MPSLFDGTDKLICDAIEIQHRKELNRKTLRIKPLSDDKAFSLIDGLYEQMVVNYSRGSVSQSEMLWCCRRAIDIKDDNERRETLLEKAVARLAHADHMPEWFNQCPVASGITNPDKDGNRAIDIIHIPNQKARLIELKWGSDSPAHALFQILEYGLAYIFARLRMYEFKLETRRLMLVKQIGLEVVGPHGFFVKGMRSAHLFDVMDRAIGKFAAEKTDGALSMSLCALSFPVGFVCIPFKNGKTVKAKCRKGTLSREGTMVRDAFSQLVPA